MATEDANHEFSHQWRRAYLIEAVLLVLLAAAAFGGRLWLVHVEFVGGLNNCSGASIWAAFRVYPVLALVSVTLAIGAITQLFLSPRTCRHVLLRFGFLIAIPAIFAGSLAVAVPGELNAFERGYEQWILKEVDIDAIQQWLAAEGHKYAGQGYYTSGNFLEDWPGFLTEFKPQYVAFPDSASQRGPYVEFEWGGPLRHWGFAIGLPTMPMPEEGAIDLTPTLLEYRYPIKPGVYIFERG